jgi:hypothetical protein
MAVLVRQSAEILEHRIRRDLGWLVRFVHMAGAAPADGGAGL